MNNPISRVIRRADLLELPQTCMSLLAASPAPLGGSRREARRGEHLHARPLVPRRWGIRGGWRVPRHPRRIEHMYRLPLCGRAPCKRELQRVHRAPRGEAEQLAYLWGERGGSGRAVVSACMRAEVSRAAYPQRACNQRPSEAHQKVIRRPSEGHQKVIKRSSEVIVSEDAYP
jgi:hypothetical protein